MKKTLAILLALILVLGMVACGATTETKTETTETKTETTETKKEEPKKEETKEEATEESSEREVLTAKALVFSTPGFTPQDGSTVDNYYLEKYDLDLEILPVDTGTEEMWSTFWAGEGYADVIVPFHGGLGKNLIGEELVRPIELDWIEEYMPAMWTALSGLYGDKEAIRKELSVNGEVYCIPYVNDTAMVSWNTAIRNDWLEAVGLEMPTTVEEYGEVLRAFTEDDPDGDGLDDTYGASGWSYSMWNVPAAYGTSEELSFWKQDDGSFITNANADNYREFLRTVSEWYQNGWLDPESITDDRSAIRNKLANGTIGVYCDNPWWFEYARGEVGPLQMLCAGQGLDFETACSFVTGLEDVNTGDPIIQGIFASLYTQCSVYFGYDCPDEVIFRVMQLVDNACVLYDGSEEDKARAVERFETWYDFEGTDWEIGENGYPVAISTEGTSQTPEYQQEHGWQIFGGGVYKVDTTIMENAPDEFCIQLYKDAMIQNKVYRGQNCEMPTAEGEIADIRTNISDHFYECRTKFLVGEMDINDDAVWAEYCATLEEYGLNDLIAYYEANA